MLVRMRLLRLSTLFLGTVLFAVMLAPLTSASTVTIPANSFYSAPLGDMFGSTPIYQGSEVTFSWSSDVPLTLAVSGPSGLIKTYTSSTSGSGKIDVSETGTYFLTWTNSGSTDATLTFTYNTDLFAPVEHTINTVLLAIVIGAIATFVVIAVVVVLILKAEKAREPTQAQRGQEMYVVPPTAAVCPNCGMAIDSTTIWCSRCGVRLR
jgi:hypothetical protein